jgi:SpoIID/LytB domain protein
MGSRSIAVDRADRGQGGRRIDRQQDMTRRSIRRVASPTVRTWRTTALLGLAAAVLASGAPLPIVSGAGSAGAAAPETLQVVGRGNGHGIGMSQWGAYGYAADHGWSAGQILDHYYGGTVAGTTDATSITVRLMNLDNRQTAVVHDKGALAVDGVGGPWRSVVVREISDRNYGVWVRTDASVCPAADDPLNGWTQVASGLSTVTVRPTTDTSASADVSDLVAVCEPSGRVRSYRGAIRAANGTEGENRTINEVPLEQYLRAVVASEMSASWAPRGSAALQAQAIAARSFGLAENRYSYARTCDQICQFYPGAAWRTSVTGAYTRTEHASVDAAVQATATQVRRVGHTGGPIALTMFSSSSGGWTAPSTLPFPAVPDVGDSTSGNPHHRWQATIAVSAITKTWPQIGEFTSVTVTSRNGHGEWGGRVLTVTVAGTAGSVSVAGDTFRRAVGLRSNWFDIAGAGESTATGGSADAGGSAAAARCEGRDEPAIGTPPAMAPAARFEPIVPVRLVDTRDGTGTIARPLAGGCTLRIQPEVPSGTTAVSVNVVTVEPVAQGYVTVYPCGIARPFTSAVQSQVGRIVSGSAIVPLGVDGSFCVFSNTTTEIVVDLNGSFAPAASARYEPIVTQRRFDSRPSGRRLAVGEVVRVQTRGFGGGAADSTAASVTIHGLDAAASGFITAWPCDTPRPWASSANVMVGSSVSNGVDVAVGPTGEVCFLVSAPMHLAIDLNGWYGPSATTDYYSVTPFRLADTRESFGFAGAFRRNVDRSIQVSGVGGLPATARSVAAQFTAVDAGGTGWVTAHPCLSPVPQVSMLRYETRTNVAVLVNTLLSGAGRWCVTTSTSTHLVVDVSGWFG